MIENYTVVETGENVKVDTRKFTMHEIITIKDKAALVGRIGTTVRGENNSQAVVIQMERFYDNDDLKDCKFYIIYKNGKGNGYKVEAKDVMYSNTHIRFNWLVDEYATVIAGDVPACVQIENADGNYTLKSSKFTITVEESVLPVDVPETDTWIKKVENSIKDLDTKTFVGTQEEVAAAIASGEIVEHTIVIITDESEDE